jgi:carbon monoxide dehydrogenase subunit G
MDSDSRDVKKIFNLTDVLEEKNGKNNQEVIVIDGRGYEKNVRVNNIHEIVNEAEEKRLESQLNDDIMQRVTEITERIVREIVPEIAERIVREEIEKLKKMSSNELKTNE